MLKHHIIQKFKREKSLMNTPSLTKIKIIGVGGAGGNAINRISTDDPNIEIIGFNTDVQALGQIKNPVRTFAIGPDCTSGMGSGGDPITGNRAIKESREQVEDLLKDTDLLVTTTGNYKVCDRHMLKALKKGCLLIRLMTLQQKIFLKIKIQIIKIQIIKTQIIKNNLNATNWLVRNTSNSNCSNNNNWS